MDGMNKEEFLKKSYNKIEIMDEQDLKNCLRKIIKIIPDDKRINFLDLLSENTEFEVKKVKNIKSMYDDYVKIEIEKINEWIELVESSELTLEGDGYEDYSKGYWSSEVLWEYRDPNKLGIKIEEALSFADKCISDYRYEEALSIMELIMDLQVEVENEWDDEFNLDLEELVNEKIIEVRLEKFALKVLYCNYKIQTKENRAESCYLYFSYPYFKDIHIEDIFNIGKEELNDTDYFWNNWIEVLMTKSGDVALRLLKEAILYHKGEEGLLIQARLGYSIHPSLYLLAVELYEKKYDYINMMKIGEEALGKIDRNMIIRSEVALKTSLAAYFLEDEMLMQKYWYEAYDSNSTVVNYLRLFTSKNAINMYKDSAEEKIDAKLISKNVNYGQSKELLKNYIHEYEYNCLCFFSGQFKKVKNLCNNPKSSLGWTGKFIEAGISLFMLYIYQGENLGKAMIDIENTMSDDLGFKKDVELIFINKYSKDSIIKEKNKMILWSNIKKWKVEYSMSNEEKNEYIIWIEDIINKRTQAIVSGQYRGKYGSVALLIAALGEVKETLGVIDEKASLIHKFTNMFPRHSAFRAELNKYK